MLRHTLRPLSLLGSLLFLQACAGPMPVPDASAQDGGNSDVSSMDIVPRDTGVCVDNDNDGHPSAACGGDDCDDNNPRRNPGIREVCDNLGVDEDCDLCTVAEVSATGRGGDGDRDEDGFFSRNCFNAIGANDTPPMCTATVDAGVADGGGRSFDPVAVSPSEVRGTDCADDPAAGGASRSPASAEICNNLDDDCDNEVDNGVGLRCYQDNDRDGYAAVGAMTLAMPQCMVCPSGWTSRAPQGAEVDCNDAPPADGSRGGMDIHPRASDLCNGVDDDCDPMTLDGTNDLRIDAVCSMTGGVGRCSTGRNVCEPMTGLRCAPTVAVREMCNAEDDDCDGMRDESLCVDSTIDPLGRQTAPSGFGVCIAGNRCQIGVCVPGRASCDNDATNGCETDLRADANHCGACGASCYGEACVNGSCQRLPNALSFSVGARHACAVLPNRTVVCWGSNDNGQLGDGTNTDRSQPVAVLSLSDAVEVSAGATSTCARRTNGTVLCWGANSSAQLGDGTTVARRSPTAVVGLVDAVEISVAYRHACARRMNGQVVCWGANDFGQLGIGRASPFERAPQTVVNITNAVELALGGGDSGVGSGFSCARLATGQVQCWGANNMGVLGNGLLAGSSHTPVTVMGISRAVTQISAGTTHACALLSDGNVGCWGVTSMWGPAAGARAMFTLVSPFRNAAGIAAASHGTCAWFANGGAACVGGNQWGQTGSNLMDLAFPAPVPVQGVMDFARLEGGSSISDSFVCGRRTNNAILCWGSNAVGQLGDGTTVRRGFPARTLLTSAYGAVSGGRDFTCARRAFGEVACWGSNASAQFGNGAMTSSPFPTPVSLLTDAVQVASGRGHSCAIRSTGQVFCWGDNRVAQLGNGGTATTLTPTAVLGITDAVELSAGAVHTCVRRANGTVMCWGDNVSGQLGDGSTLRRMTPSTVMGLTDALSISAGEAHTCAVSESRGVLCWGSNTDGQLGEGTLMNRLLPTPSATVAAAVEVLASAGFTCARSASGSVSCWGRNAGGQLGDGTTAAHLTPAPVMGLTNAVELVRGTSHVCARLADGAVACWGDNNAGQLGDNSSTRRLTPTRVTGLTNAVSLGAGDQHTCARRSNGTLFCWGANDTNQLGTGSPARNVAVPGLVLGY
ncbi:MAG: MopE-related protein [Polyangiales bacterium]